ncbi:molybdenum cofactor guanylyltransferase MobA [Candidatus Nitrotoga sp. 1052]|uniref:molybdenum cofactor guanylyltransferase MobA n=1 Tax=Candidatus Nitrotoga sp. 1052 TaxID=2886964 RepID=UPI001EF70DA1|nr:molybdenum cofactor guanylyltransferase MobA [Candidatus Nitrotoga sp. 1052]CAH1081575.1 Molybdenum cofactor guanylyltransferase [Candidatus Nitrotoga sp. 1052]
MRTSWVKFERLLEPARPAITTVILAGGLGTRIGGAKGLQPLRGRALIDWVLDSVSRQSEEVLINANDEHDDYLCFGYPVIADQTPNWAGPLAGLQSALRLARNDWVASVPCDTPFLPDDLIARLYKAVSTTTTVEASVAVVAGKRQPTIALYHKNVLPKLDAYLNSGGRKVNSWLETLHLSEAVLDDAIAFTNINTLDDLAHANQIAVNVHSKDATESSIIKKEKWD